MKRTGRTLVILTMAAWLAALTPAWAAPTPAGDDPIRIGVGIGGDIIDVLNHDEDNGDDEGNGDEDGDGLLHGLVALLVGNGDDDEGEGDGLVTRVLEVLFGEEGDSVDSAPVVTATVVPAAASRPADDEGVVGEVLELLEDDDIEVLEDVLDLVEDTVDFVLISVGDNQVVATVCQVRHGLHNGIPILPPIVIPPIGGAAPPMCTP